MSSLPAWVKDCFLDQPALKEVVLSCSKKLKSQRWEDQLCGAEDLYSLIILVWSLDTSLARDAADIVCDNISDLFAQEEVYYEALRMRFQESGGLEALIKLCSSTDKALRLAILRALEQVMVANNRKYIAGHQQFNLVVKVATSNESLEAIQAGTGILENLFKDSTQTCLRLIKLGALEGVILGCRSTDPIVLQHCAAALANCAMYGEAKAHTAMVRKYVDHWLFPLAFSSDEVVKYYALLAICFLDANPQVSHKVAESGTLDLVLPFLNSQDPEEFRQSCPNHAHGRSEGWLRRLVPLLVSHSEQARSLVAFHLAMEAGVKKKQHRLQILSDINALEHLQKAAKYGSKLTAKFCVKALAICEASGPPYQCWDVINWSVKEVSAWVKETLEAAGDTQIPDFSLHHVTGSLLLDLEVNDLMEIGFNSRVSCKWFLEEIKKLRCMADTSGTESGEVCKWLTENYAELAVYRTDFVQKGITKTLLPHLTDEILSEIGVSKKLDRLRITLAVAQSMEGQAFDTPDQVQGQFLLPTPSTNKKFDVFISYRRSTGSQLASLLKVHLQLRGLSVFLDVAELGSGKFDEAILTTIAQSSNFVLILSDSCLDRCKGDTHVQDWLHKEILCAVENSKHSVPVVEANFKWPKDTELPAGIRQLTMWNGVPWSHEYQEASVEKLISFLQLPPGAHRLRANTRSYMSLSSVASSDL